MQKILVWLLKFALSALGENLDAETKAQVDEYNRRKAALEKTEETAAIELGAIETKLQQFKTTRAANAVQIAHLESEIEAQEIALRNLENEKNEKLDNLRRSDDDAVLHRQM